MPDWNSLNDEIRIRGTTHDILRREYLKKLYEITKRNIIIYYSGWLQKNARNFVPVTSINDNDKNAFMTTVHELDRSKGLDLILHTPGGETAATESIVHYLRKMFDGNVRAIVPQLALSAGTMIALSCNSICMGKQSSLGPIDPQINGMPAHSVLQEFERAFREIRTDISRVPIWQAIMAKYPSGFIIECENSIRWSMQMVCEWLRNGMFKEEIAKGQSAKVDGIVSRVIEELGHEETLSHARHISAEKCQEIGLKIEMMEDNQELQDAVLTVHHITMLALTDTTALKVVENHEGKAYIQNMLV
jgi:ClpP class serine protease